MLGFVQGLLKPVLGSFLFDGDGKDVSTSHTLLAYAVVDRLEKLCKARKEELKARVLPLVEEHGKREGEGKFRIKNDDLNALVTHKRSKLPVEEDFRAKLQELGIDLESVYDLKTSWVLNPSKIDQLIEFGHLDKAVVQELKTMTKALRVTPSAALKKAISA